MSTVLITAFGPYGSWTENASWLALVELTKRMPEHLEITTRRFAVEFGSLDQLSEELSKNYDYALHLGQAPGSGRVELEQIGVNVGGYPDQAPHEYEPLAEDGLIAYRSELPLGDWAAMIRNEGIPTEVSHHAGVYLCNAFLYWTHYFCRKQSLNTKATFIHLPLASSQVLDEFRDWPSLPAAFSARAIELILQQL